MTEFKPFPKISRFNREVIVTEKIDGTNASVFIEQDGTFLTGSRNKWITPENDNFGFSRWAHEHKDELLTLGPGIHYGEWWGAGIGRRYGIAEKRFSLFNTHRWGQGGAPACVSTVPVIWTGLMLDLRTDELLELLSNHGSFAAPGFTKPEGIVIYHVASGAIFKRTIEKDDSPKGAEVRE